jgi:hypothetical protein
MDATAPAASEIRSRAAIAALLAAAAVTIAVLGARASDLAGAAGGRWEQAVRAQVKQSALKTEDELYVYGDPVTLARQHEAARIRAEEYRRELSRRDLTPAQRASLLALAAVEESVAADRGLALAVHLDAAGADGAAFDLAGALARERREGAAALAGAREATAAGDDLSTRAAVEALLVVPAALAFLLGSAARARPQSAGPLLLAGTIALAASLVAAVAAELAG